MRDGFLLDPGIAYFNHGGYGACPVEVFEEYQRLQRELERDPTAFLDPAVRGRDVGAGTALAAFVGAARTTSSSCPTRRRARRRDPLRSRIRPRRRSSPRSTNTARSCAARVHPRERGPGRARRADREHRDPHARDRRLAHHVADRARASDRGDLRGGAEGGCAVDRRRRARARSPAARVDAIGADVYAGNCHKWLCAPKGCGFLWARPEHQEWIEPLVVSWGYHEDAEFGERHGWQGKTRPRGVSRGPDGDRRARDVRRGGGGKARRRGGAAARGALGLRPLRGTRAPFMRALMVRTSDPAERWRRLDDEHHVEIPVYEWEDTTLLRVSIGPYNDEADLERLVTRSRDSRAT